MTPIRVPEGLNHSNLHTRDLTHAMAGDLMSPFLVVSRFSMTGPVFPPHPHAGFSVATYILPESPVGFWNQDTLGTVNRIAPGSLHWTVAGSGLQHEETVERSGKPSLGFQIWIDHPEALREAAPRAIHIAAADMPQRETAGVRRRVVVGQDAGVDAPVAVPVAVSLVDATAAPGAVWVETLAEGHRGFAWVLSGHVTGDGAVAAADEVIPLRDGLVLSAPGGARIVRFSGLPLPGTPVFGGSFVGGSAAQLAAFRTAYRSGRMGQLAPFDQTALDRGYDAATGRD